MINLNTITDPVPAASAGASPSEFAFIDRRFAPRCSDFINSSGELGPWGKELIKSIDRVGQGCFYNSKVFNGLCPKYLDLSLERKKQFVAFLSAYMAEDEGNYPDERCNPNFKKAVPTYSFTGLMRLEESASVRRNSGRSSTFCGKGNPQDIEFQMQYSSSMFSDLHCSRNASLSKSYGMSLRRLKKPEVRKQFPKFPGCN